MNSLKKVIFNCNHATFLIEKKLLDKISFRETMELRLHLLGCRMCRLYTVQSQMITRMVSQALHLKLDERFKTILQAQVADRLNKN